MRKLGLVLSAVGALAAPAALAADPTPKHSAESRALCQAALDRVEDLASTPAANVSLTSDDLAGLTQGLALCRAGRIDKGAKLVGRAIRAIRLPE